MISSHSKEGLAVNRRALDKRRHTQDVVGFSVCTLTLEQHIDKILEWADFRLSKVVCVANVHMIMEGHWHRDFSRILAQADMLTPDGMPLAWMVSWLRLRRQDRVAGMDLFLGLCKRAKERPVSLFFVGSTPDILSAIQVRIEQEFPNVDIAGVANFPFRKLTREEDDALVRQINTSGTGIVLVSLGCPKQERWMTEHRDRINAVMIGLGGAFPVFAGKVRWAPAIIRKLGLEWLYRLYQEPKRLWTRYATTIPPFVFLALRQALTRRVRRH